MLGPSPELSVSDTEGGTHRVPNPINWPLVPVERTPPPTVRVAH